MTLFRNKAFLSFFLCVVLLTAWRAQAQEDVALWAFPHVAEANMRTAPSHAAELESQVTLGTPLQIVEAGEEWILVMSPDGDKGWINHSALTLMDHAEATEWRKSNRIIVKQPVCRVTKYACVEEPRSTIATLTLGCILTPTGNHEGSFTEISFPDGRSGWIADSEIESLEQWASQPWQREKIVDTAFSVMGTPYLWGGSTAKALDCSGLVKLALGANGLIPPRNASQQATTGTRIECKDFGTLTCGDLLFFGDEDTGRVTHVALYDKAGNYIHASGEVRYNSFLPVNDNYLDRKVLFGVSLADAVSSGGIKSVKNHPWYFDIE